jgi:cyanate permease
VGLCGSLGPIFGGIIYDVAGSYTHAWQINLAGLIFVTALIQFLKPAQDIEALRKETGSSYM